MDFVEDTRMRMAVLRSTRSLQKPRYWCIRAGGERGTWDQTHYPVLPDDLPIELERFGLCACPQCEHPESIGRYAAVHVGGKRIYGNRTKIWQTLSSELGDAWACWLCAWADTHEDPHAAIASVEVVLALYTVESSPLIAQLVSRIVTLLDGAPVL